MALGLSKNASNQKMDTTLKNQLFEMFKFALQVQDDSGYKGPKNAPCLWFGHKERVCIVSCQS